MTHRVSAMVTGLAYFAATPVTAQVASGTAADAAEAQAGQPGGTRGASGDQRGLCKPPVAAGRGTGDRSVAMVPGHPEQSIIAYRMDSTDPGEMMPELGRALANREGSALVQQYIKELVGGCDAVDGTNP